MKCLELIQKLETLAPADCACEWDNVGLLVGWREREIHRILIALDATDEVVEEAVRMRADLLLTHHPLIFKPLRKVNDDDFIARRVMELIQYNVNYYAMHTNFDAAPAVWPIWRQSGWDCRRRVSWRLPEPWRQTEGLSNTGSVKWGFFLPQ